MSEEITADMPIVKVVEDHPETVKVFLKHGLHCIGCAAAHFETLGQGAEAHGINVDRLLEDLNKAVKQGKKKKKKKD